MNLHYYKHSARRLIISHRRIVVDFCMYGRIRVNDETCREVQSQDCTGGRKGEAGERDINVQ